MTSCSKSRRPSTKDDSWSSIAGCPSSLVSRFTLFCIIWVLSLALEANYNNSCSCAWLRTSVLEAVGFKRASARDIVDFPPSRFKPRTKPWFDFAYLLSLGCQDGHAFLQMVVRQGGVDALQNPDSLIHILDPFRHSYGKWNGCDWLSLHVLLMENLLPLRHWELSHSPLSRFPSLSSRLTKRAKFWKSVLCPSSSSLAASMLAWSRSWSSARPRAKDLSDDTLESREEEDDSKAEILDKDNQVNPRKPINATHNKCFSTGKGGEGANKYSGFRF